MKKKILISYYSRTGKNEKLVQELAKKINCDIEKIVDTTNRNGIWGYLISGMQATFKMKVKIKPVKNDPRKYGTIIIVTPLWVSIMPPAVRTYLSENKEKFKNVALLSVCDSGAKVNIRALPDFESLTGKKALASLIFSEGDFAKGNYRKGLDDFIKNLPKI